MLSVIFNMLMSQNSNALKLIPRGPFLQKLCWNRPGSYGSKLYTDTQTDTQTDRHTDNAGIFGPRRSKCILLMKMTKWKRRENRQQQKSKDTKITDYELHVFKSKSCSGSFISFEADTLQIGSNANGIVYIILTKKEGRSWTKTKSNNTKTTPTVFKSTYFQDQLLQFVLIKRQRYCM